MRKFLLAVAIAATAVSAVPATAQDDRDWHHDQRDDRRDRRDDRRDERHDDRSDNRGDDHRDWRQYRNYDYNRLPRGQSAYYADQYYRDGRYYQPRRLGPNDRIYRGQDNRYYCRRNDGTTGLIVGGIAGGLLGNAIAGGGSRTLGTLLGAGGGAVLGQSIDRKNVTCR